MSRYNQPSDAGHDVLAPFSAAWYHLPHMKVRTASLTVTCGASIVATLGLISALSAGRPDAQFGHVSAVTTAVERASITMHEPFGLPGLPGGGGDVTLGYAMGRSAHGARVMGAIERIPSSWSSTARPAARDEADDQEEDRGFLSGALFPETRGGWLVDEVRRIERTEGLRREELLQMEESRYIQERNLVPAWPGAEGSLPWGPANPFAAEPLP